MSYNFNSNLRPSERGILRAQYVWTRGVALVCAGLGILVFVWAFTDPRWRDSEGLFAASVGVPIAAGLALLCMAWAIGNVWRKFCFWFSLGLIGQAVALQLIDAGTAIHYQHYWGLDKLLAEKLLAVLFVIAQTILVTAALAKRFYSIRAWLRRTFRVWQLAALLAVFAFSSAALSRDISGYAAEVIWATGLQLVNLGNLVLMVWALPADAARALQQRVRRLIGDAETTTDATKFSLDRFAVFAGIWVTAISALLAIFAYEQHPHVADEVAYLLHARFLAAGALTLPAPAVPQAFEIYLMQFRDGQWFAATPPGFPALLAIGVRLGAPWLVNPILGGVNVLLAYLFIQELYDRKIARWVVLLLSVSPWFLFMNMNFMTHTFTLTCALAAGVLVAWAKRQQRIGWALLAGVFAGMGSLIRPLDGLIVAALLGLWILGAKGMRWRVGLLTALALGTILISAVVLPYNLALTGKATVFPLNAYLDEQFGAGKNDLGFGENRGYGWALQPFPGHSPLGAMVNTALNIFSLNTELFGWSIGSLLLLTVFLVSGEMRRRDLLMLAVLLVTIVVFAFYWYSGGPDFGARYWYIVLIPCIALTVRGMQVLQSKLARAPNESSAVAGAVMVAVVLLSGLSLVNYVPWRALDKYHHYLGMRPDILALAETYQLGGSLVLLRGESFPDYASTIVYNPLDLASNQPIYAWERDDSVVRELMAAYPNRPVWIVDGPTRTHSGYRVIAGPLAPKLPAGHTSVLPPVDK
jgi:4-amino-4-deoxy-L-arabinose transferase-like glycosyltransferase